jgi:hypothetical protein
LHFENFATYFMKFWAYQDMFLSNMEGFLTMF